MDYSLLGVNPRYTSSGAIGTINLDGTNYGSLASKSLPTGLASTYSYKDANTFDDLDAKNLLNSQMKPTENKSWWGEAADWAGDKNNQALVGMGLGATQVGLGLANYLQSSDFMKKQGRLLDQQIANNEYEMGRRQGFSRALADAQNQTQVG